MKKTDLEKNKGLKIANSMKQSGANRGGTRLRVIRDPAAELAGADAPGIEIHDPEIPRDLTLRNTVRDQPPNQGPILH